MSVDDVLSGRAGAVGIRSGLLGPSSRRALRREIGALLEDNVLPVMLRLRRVKFKPGRKLTAHFDLSLGERVGTSRPIVVRWERGDGGWGPGPAAAAREREAHNRGVAAPFRNLASRVPDGGPALLIWPLDPALPQLTRLCDPDHVGATLARLTGSPPAVGPPIVSAVRYRPGERHVLRYDLPGALFAKLARSAAPARELHTASRAADWLEGFGSRFGAARPLASIEGAVLYPEAPGRPLSRMLAADSSRAAASLSLAGSLLRALHGAPASVGAGLRSRSIHDEANAASRASEHTVALLPRTGAIIGEIVDRALAGYEAIPSEVSTFLHGDFKADHLLSSPRGVVLFDFGSSALGDPALDLGKFLADLRWWRVVGGHGASDARDRFLEAYGPDDARLARSRLFEALFLVKIAAHRVPLFDPDWAERTGRLVERARLVLEEVERRPPKANRTQIRGERLPN